jgi:hypothetical protein
MGHSFEQLVTETRRGPDTHWHVENAFDEFGESLEYGPAASEHNPAQAC